MGKYFPEGPPSIEGIKDRVLYEWIFRELNRISTATSIDAHLDVEKQFVAPAKPQDGDIVYADGTNWNPGGGVGIYAFINGVWNKLST